MSLEDYCVETTEHTGLKIDYQGVEVNDLPEEIGISLFRILQEALTNVLKHARASKVKVNLNNMDSGVLLSIKDNGRGMAEPAVSNGIGLLGIRERVDLLGGNFKINTQPGIGTQLVISIPWEKDMEDKK